MQTTVQTHVMYCKHLVRFYPRAYRPQQRCKQGESEGVGREEF